MTSLVQAIKDKYDPAEDNVDSSNVCVLFVPKSGPNIGPSGKLSLPQRLTVDNCQIGVAGEENEIAELCEKVHELDLSKNDLTDWHEVFTIVRSIPNLHFLNLLMNKLDDSTNNSITGSYPNMKNLVLNSTLVSWNTVSKLLQVFPSLSELHLSLNQYSAIELPEDVQHTQLNKLFLNQCRINSWTDIVKLGKAFPNLDSLNLIQTELETLSCAEEDFKWFSNLTTLNISETKLTSWEEIDKFRKFPMLTHLRIAGIQFLEDWEAKQRRQHLVSRLPNITTLNGSKITDTEREDGERAFIRYFMDLENKPARYFELEEKYGKLDPLAVVDLKPKTTMKLMIVLGEDRKTVEVNIRKETVADLKKKVAKLSGVKVSKCRLFHVAKMEGRRLFSSELKLNSRSLLGLNISEEDEFEVE